MSPAARGGPQPIPRPSDHGPGRPAPWAELSAEERSPDLALVRARLEAFGPPVRNQHLGAGTRESAVLALLYEAEPSAPGRAGRGQPEVVLTRRAQHMRSHRGEVSFPGGGQEPGETLIETALREAHEEIGLDPAGVEVVGELDHLSTFSSRAAIAPFVGVAPGRPALAPNTSEVEHILHVPLAELLLPGVFREERWRLPSADRPIYFFELVGDTIWGATARMLRQLLAIATGVESRDTEDAW